MKTSIWAAAAVSFVMPALALAGGHEGPGGPPPSVISKINLGKAGLLLPFNLNSQQGLTGARGGRDSTRIGTAGATGITTGYQHSTKGFIPSATFSKEIQGNSAALTFGIGANIGREGFNQTQNDSEIRGFSIGYENFSNPNAAWSFTITVEERETRSQVAPVRTGADTTELRFAYARKLNEKWGFVNQTYFTFGESFASNPGGTSTTDEKEFYTQLELVGSFGQEQFGFLGENYRLHPTFGVSYNNLREDTAGVKETVEDGSVWAKLVLQKGFRPGVFTPYFTLGLEHVYKSDRGEQFIDEDTYGIFGVGGRYSKGAMSLNMSLEHRRGFKGNRDTTALVTGISFDL